MNCLVTGGSGFLGSHVADELLKKGHQVLIFDKQKPKWLSKKNKKIIIGDIKNIRSIEKNFKKKIDIVFHFAALADLNQAMSKPHDTVNYNILEYFS